MTHACDGEAFVNLHVLFFMSHVLEKENNKTAHSCKSAAKKLTEFSYTAGMRFLPLWMRPKSLPY